MFFLYALRIGLGAGDRPDAAARARDRRRPGLRGRRLGREPDHHHDRRGGPDGGHGGVALARAEHRPARRRDELGAPREPGARRCRAPVYVFLVVTVVLAVVMRRTRFGRQIYLLGENRVAARAAALPITLLTVGAFGIASLYTAGSGVLIGATSANASLLLDRELHLRRDRRRPRRRQRGDRRARVDRADGRWARSSSRRSPTCCSCAATRRAGRSSSAGSSSSSSSS